LHLFRSNFFRILIAVLVLVGYSEVVRGGCDDVQAEKAGTQVGEVASHTHSDGDSSHDDGDACVCICHQTFTHEALVQPTVPMPISVLLPLLERAAFPPDTDPLGIDYPPQLA
jgi:hypothetical protein